MTRFCNGPGCLNEIDPAKRKGTKFCCVLCRVHNDRLSKAVYKSVMPRGSISVSHAAIAFVVAEKLARDAPYENRAHAEGVVTEFQELAAMVFANTRFDPRIDDYEPLWVEEVRSARLFFGGIADSR
jgi:hypothetical protein